MLRNGVPKSGISIMASSSPATQNRWMCVKSASRPKMATISNCNFSDFVRHALREAMQSQIERPDPDEGGNQKNAHHHHQHIGPAPWGEVEGQMMRGHRMNLLAQRSLSKRNRAGLQTVSCAPCIPPVQIC